MNLGRPAARLSAPLWFFGLSGFSTAVSGTGTSVLLNSKTEVERAVMAEVSGTSRVRCANLTDRPFRVLAPTVASRSVVEALLGKVQSDDEINAVALMVRTRRV